MRFSFVYYILIAIFVFTADTVWLNSLREVHMSLGMITALWLKRSSGDGRNLTVFLVAMLFLFRLHFDVIYFLFWLVLSLFILFALLQGAIRTLRQDIKFGMYAFFLSFMLWSSYGFIAFDWSTARIAAFASGFAVNFLIYLSGILIFGNEKNKLLFEPRR